MKETTGFLNLLENSNQNGFGFLVVTVLFYLFVFFLIQFFQHKKRFYLLYSLYALINGVGLLKYIDGVFFSNYFDSAAGKSFVVWSHYPAQLFGTMLFTYFILEIMQIKKGYPKAVKIINYYFLTLSIIYLSLWIVFAIDRGSFLIDYFHAFVFIPVGYLVFFWVLYMVFKQKVAIKWYILTGMLVLAITYFIIFFYSFQNLTANNQTLYVFYIGILIESLLFALAIGLEQKVVYKEKAVVQEKYIKQLEENHAIKESINRTLSDELTQTRFEMEDITAEAQRERTEKLTMKFENKFSQLRLDAIRSQMSPHFIFNALNSIKSYFIENNRDKAIFYLTKFSKLIRSILESSRKEQISLAEELDILKMYVEIESDRFKNDIEFSIVIDETIATEKVLVPALFLQPFVENAIWHGLSTKQGKKLLSLKIERDKSPETVKIKIEDNGVGRKVTRERNAENPFKKESLGLTLVRDRLDLFSKKFGKTYQYTIQDLINTTTKKPTGTLVLIQLPETVAT